MDFTTAAARRQTAVEMFLGLGFWFPLVGNDWRVPPPLVISSK
jgi:hypothetical protein